MREITALAVLVTMLTAAASAGTLATDPNALVYDGTTWRDSVVMTDGADLTATVDYAVFHEDDWAYSGYTPEADPNFPSLPVYVYAYQVSSSGSDDVMKFYVSMLESNEARNISTFIVDSGDTDAVSASLVELSGEITATAKWEFDDGEGRGLQTGQHTVGLVYSSVNVPITSFLAMGHVHDGGSQASWLVATPSDYIPEPITVSLMAIGAIGLLRKRR